LRELFFSYKNNAPTLEKGFKPRHPAARLSRKPTISSIEEILSGKSGSVEMSKQGSKRAKGPNGAKLAKQGNKKFNLDISSSHASLSLLNPSCSGASLNGRGF